VTGRPRRTGLTPDELVGRLRRDGIRVSSEQMTNMLGELRASGVTEDVGGRNLWRLTPDAQQRFGHALGNLRSDA
jgi:hypothetical protein